MNTASQQFMPPGEELGGVLRDYLEVAGRLQRTHETLQHEMSRLREELASKDRELERRRRLAALGELAAGVAHEVRNPLGAIQLYSGLLRAECARAELAPAIALLEKIEAGVRAIDGVVQDTLALAPRSRRPAACSVALLLERAHDVARRTFEKHGVNWRCDPPPPGTQVLADENGLQRVLVNLIMNAAEASPRGSAVRVCVETGDPAQVSLRVQDAGPGLPDEVMDRIFDPFFTTKPHGTGLGLTIAHRLVEAYGGRLSAHNRPEGGAEFVIALPAPQGGQSRAPGQSPIQPEELRQYSAA